MVFQRERLGAREVLALVPEPHSGMAHADVVRERAADQPGEARRRAQGGPEEAGGHDRRPHRMLEADAVVALERLDLVPDLLGEAHVGQDVGGQAPQALAADQVLQRRSLERLQHRVRTGGLREGPVAELPRRLGRDLLEHAQIDDLTAGSDQPTIRREEVPGQDRPRQGEVHRALEGPGEGGWARAQET